MNLVLVKNKLKEWVAAVDTIGDISTIYFLHGKESSSSEPSIEQEMYG